MRNTKGQFAKGNKGKPKGSSNKSSTKIREAFTEIMNNNLDRIQEDIDSLDAKDRLNFLKDFAGYCIPKLRSTEMSIEQHNADIEPIEIKIMEEEEIRRISKVLDEEYGIK